MKRIFLFVLPLLLYPAGPAQAAEAGFPETVRLGETRLAKVGQGTFRWFLIHVYDGSLYLDAERAEADPLGDVAKRLELSYRVGISAEDFIKSGMKILRDNLDPMEMTLLEERLVRFNAAYRPVQPGDRYALTYLPGDGTTLSLNGDPLVTIKGADFARAYFSIWLGGNPVKKSFREDLLGL